MKRLIIGFVALLSLPFASFAQSADALDGRLKKIHDSKSIGIAYRTDAAPFSFEDNKQITGYSIDICRRVVASIERQLDALEESLGKRVPEVESRLLHLLERRLGALEAELHRRVSDLATDVALDADRSRSDQRRLLWAIAIVGVLVLIF